METQNLRMTSPPVIHNVSITEQPKVVYKGATNYKFKKKIGEGAVGEVFLVIHKQSQEVFALKRIKKLVAESRGTTQEVLNERRIMTAMPHSPEVVALKGGWTDKTYVYLLFDYALNGDLSNFLKNNGPLNYDTALHFSAQILKMLSFLREQNLIHRDLKPANLMLNEHWALQLADFGSARRKVSSAKSSVSVCSGYSGLSHISSVSNVSNVSNVS
mmetsp:Transcript_42603/g.65336  ORF Transcript_42603/g.65336 Transcript_42603/m.65336 type:complete len:216 (-) Transcript_42603:1409-2056(-)|eukprot:CAMPEP_0170482828 /NCGR_PEP_ID=MMETSP0208-20121228/2671_1 /TAXON_ID=197538 /ORGANISM="Strombidium inclinatum, Strain S3" /LENGTH=215 /DNA_ID=CAMNT_0010755703 /DNA_START=278 /DNA_END=925 /DNA_ORIENTATION=+